MTGDITPGVKDLLEKVSTRGDLATVLIAGTAGYLLDAGLNLIGFLEPGIVGVLSASGALGVKKAIEAGWERHPSEKYEQKALAQQKVRAARLMDLLEREGRNDLATKLRREINLIETGVITPEISSAAIDEVIQEYRISPGGGGSR
jgi:hypothetical protein